MGNSGSSHQQQVTLIEGPPHSWAHSFPRTTSFKVLPDRVPGQRLRLTDNGAILHNGGTISGRKPYAVEPQPKIQVTLEFVLLQITYVQFFLLKAVFPIGVSTRCHS